MKKFFQILPVLAAMAIFLPTYASLPDGYWVKARVGYGIGGTAPLGVPATIRSLDKLRLTPNLSVGADVGKPISGPWGIATGLYLANKGMDAEITTKGYKMALRMDESEMEGVYTGHVRQQVTQWMLTLPVTATYELPSRWMLRGGPYLSAVLSKDFSGYAYDGYLRQDSPTGPKVVMGSSEGEWATYDFSSDMRRLQAGILVGADWQMSEAWGLSADLQWGLTGIHHSDFKTVEQTLYPIYGTICLTYNIKNKNN